VCFGMARVRHFSRETVKALAGIIDFYYWKGIPVARKWPDWSNFKPSPRQAESMQAFAAIRSDMKKISPAVRDLWRAACVGRTNAWVDMFTFLWFQYWRQGISPAPVLLDVSKQVQGNNLILSLQFSVPPSSHLIVGDGFYKGVPRTRDSKGKPEHCWDPPVPKPPPVPIPPVPIQRPIFGKVQLSMSDNSYWGRGATQIGGSSTYEGVYNLAVQKYDARSWSQAYSYYDIGISAWGYHGYSPPTINWYQYSCCSYARNRMVDLTNWFLKYPSTDPDVLFFEDDPSSWSTNATFHDVQCGYTTSRSPAFAPGSPIVTVSAAGPSQYVIPFVRSFVPPGTASCYLLYRVIDPAYVLIPPCDPPNQWHNEYCYYYGPSRVYAAFQSSGYQASIPLSSLAGLSAPVAFVFSHNLPAVAPPIPLS